MKGSGARGAAADGSDQSSMASIFLEVICSFAAYWQASHSGLSMEHAVAADKSGADPSCGIRMGALADIIVIDETLLSLPSVPLSVDFSTWVALRERR
jgi:hypothetical protein